MVNDDNYLKRLTTFRGSMGIGLLWLMKKNEGLLLQGLGGDE
jgi:hypothetical protein